MCLCVVGNGFASPDHGLQFYKSNHHMLTTALEKMRADFFILYGVRSIMRCHTFNGFSCSSLNDRRSTLEKVQRVMLLDGLEVLTVRSLIVILFRKDVDYEVYRLW